MNIGLCKLLTATLIALLVCDQLIPARCQDDLVSLLEEENEVVLPECAQKCNRDCEQSATLQLCALRRKICIYKNCRYRFFHYSG